MPRIVLVGGGSSSGKSFLTGEVIRRIGKEHVTHLALDDYYKDQSDMPLEERYKVNYDHPRAFDWPLLRKQIRELKEGKTIQKPTYDFVTLTRGKEVETISPQPLIVIEGIMALVDASLRELGDLRVFIEASAERRFLRRMIRDAKERGRSFENIVHQYFDTVQPMYDEIVQPSSMYADLIINNDGVENRAINVLTVLFQTELEAATRGDEAPRKQEEEFSEDALSSVFAKHEK